MPDKPRQSNKKLTKVAVAMSGGVDSSVAALLLKQQGYEVIGVFMKFWGENEESNKCCSVESHADARLVAQKIGIPLYTFNMQIPFKKYVVDYFVGQYQAGKTPNACIFCNKTIKFGLFLEKAKRLGCQYIATGHYAKRIGTKLYIPKDTNKDQTYFLYTLGQHQIKHVLFPIASLTKPEVRKIAERHDLIVHGKDESQGLCFVGPDEYGIFLKKYINEPGGDIIDTQGIVVGKHQGLYAYTLGQRGGLNITNGQGPYYVIKRDYKKNTVVVSNDPEDAALYQNSLFLTDPSWLSGHAPRMPFVAKVKVRYRQKAEPATISRKDRRVCVTFQKPVRAVASGQSAVIYRGKQLLGGGIIV